mgnify:CR=1 FL=1
MYCIFRFLGAAQNGKRGAVELGFIAEDIALLDQRPFELLIHDRSSFHFLYARKGEICCMVGVHFFGKKKSGGGSKQWVETSPDGKDVF